MELREIDFLVAEKVMNRCAHREHKKYSCQGDWGMECVVCRKEEYCPKYSTDFAAAGEVLNVLKREYFHVQINIFSDSVNMIIWQDDITPLFDAEADTIPMAISLVALKTKGVEIEMGGVRG